MYTSHAEAQAIDSKSQSFDFESHSSAASDDGAGHQAGQLHCSSSQKLLCRFSLSYRCVIFYSKIPVSIIPPKNLQRQARGSSCCIFDQCNVMQKNFRQQTPLRFTCTQCNSMKIFACAVLFIASTAEESITFKPFQCVSWR